MLSGRPKVFRDPIHRDITYDRGEFQELVVKIVNSSPFQRLRSIRQNGVANLVFHGAEHSRFGHCMGVAWIVGQMYDAAVRNSGMSPSKDERESTIMAGLLHDLGHGPFSHLLEEILTRKHFDHERFTIRLITETGSEVNKALCTHSAAFADALVPFIDKSFPSEEHWYYGLVSSQLDGDRLDYLARDGYMAGIQSHTFDSSRLISFLGVVDNHLVVDERARDVLENYLLALDQMYQSVYYHHTVRAASFLVSRIIQRAIDVARSGDPEMVFPSVAGRRDPLWGLITDGIKCPLNDFIALDEPHIWNLFRFWTTSKDGILSDLSRRMAERRFPKAISLTLTDFKALSNLQKSVSELWDRQNPRLGSKYYIDIDEPDRIGYKRYRADEGPKQSILISDRNGKVVPIEDMERNIASVICTRFVAKRLMVPPEIAEKAQEIMKER